MKMNLVLAALLLTACATPYDPQEIEAVRDFVAANELEETDRIRLYSQLRFTYVNDFFVTVPSRQGDYLVEFQPQCRALRRQDFTPEMVDVRHDNNVIRSKFDTIRGCRIHKIYQISEEQRRELEELGDAPGDEVYTLDEDEAETE